MGAQLILGAQQILMVLGAQGAREPRTMKCTKAENPPELSRALVEAIIRESVT